MFWDECQNVDNTLYQGVDYEDLRKSEGERHLTQMALDLERDAFNMGLSTYLNQFCYVVFQLDAWERVFQRVDQQTKNNLLYGTVTPLTEWSISAPSIFRKKLVYCGYMILCHAEESMSGPMGEIKEVAINYKTLANHATVAKLNLEIDGLLSAIASVNATEISEYRKQLHHRWPRNVGIGQSRFITRSKDGRAFGFGGEDPFELDDLLSLFQSESKAMKTALFAYDSFVESLFESLKNVQNA